MVVPMLAFPDTFYAFAAIMVNVFDQGAFGAVAPYYHAAAPAVAGVYGAAVLAHLGLGYWRADDPGTWLVDAGETLLLVAYFATVPVLVAVGLYFPLWYSARQVARTAAVDRPAPHEGDDLLAFEDPRTVALVSWGVLVAGAAVTGGLFAGVFAVAPNPLGGTSLLPGLVALWSLFVSVVAFPHVVVGSLADRERGIWYVP
jgi:Brp/Blh family beta-carotene 15,15'-monooxygenase